MAVSDGTLSCWDSANSVHPDIFHGSSKKTTKHLDFNMTRWVPVGSASDFPLDTSNERVIDGRVFAVIHTKDGFFAMDGICLHQGGPLGKGTVCGNVLTCPWHGWQYDVTSGAHLINTAIVHPTFPTKLEADTVWIDVDPAIETPAP